MIDRDFGNWLAGFIDGEGCFFIAAVRRPRKDGTVYYTYRPIFTITIRIDDMPILEEIKEKLNGIGSLHTYQPTSGGKKTGQRVARLSIQAHQACKDLINVLDEHPLRAKKADDYEVWKKAVELSLTLQKGKGASCQQQWKDMKLLKEEMERVRAFK